MKKKWLSLLSLTLATLMLAGMLAACHQPGEGTSGEEAYVHLDINPDVSLTLDEDGNVTGVYAENEDAQVLLYGEASIVGKPLEDAVDRIIELSIELGFINEENSVVGTDVSSADAETAERVLAKVNAGIMTTTKEAKITVTTTSEAAYSLLRELEALKEQNPENEKIQSLTTSRFRLILSATESGEITFEAALELSDEELIARLQESYEKIEQFATETYLRAKTEALALYDKVAGAVLDGVYTEFYLKNFREHPTTAYYGSLYQLYTSSARGFDALADTLAYIEDIKTYELSEEQVQAVLAALDLTEDDRALIADSEGKITVRSVEAYADKLFKNSEAGVALEEMKEELTAALESAESKIREWVTAKVAAYEPEVRALLDEGLLDGLNAIAILLPAEVRVEIKACIDDFKEIATEIESILASGELGEDEMRRIADLMRKKADDTIVKIEADLSEEELASIAERRAELESTLAEAKATMESALTQAEESAKQYLERCKAARRGAEA